MVIMIFNKNGRGYGEDDRYRVARALNNCTKLDLCIRYTTLPHLPTIYNVVGIRLNSDTSLADCTRFAVPTEHHSSQSIFPFS